MNNPPMWTRSPYTGHRGMCIVQETLDESDCNCDLAHVVGPAWLEANTAPEIVEKAKQLVNEGYTWSWDPEVHNVLGLLVPSDDRPGRAMAALVIYLEQNDFEHDYVEMGF